GCAVAACPSEDRFARPPGCGRLKGVLVDVRNDCPARSSDPAESVMLHNLLRCLLTLLLAASTSIAAADDQTGPASDDQAVPDYTRDIAPLLTKYCAGCHSDGDREGDLSLQSYESLRKGTGDGPAVLAGNADSSRLIRVLTGGEPTMPPEGEQQLSDEQVALLRRWIKIGR